MTLDVGGESGQAISQVPIISSTSTEAIAFAYVVKEGDSDTDGVSISANSLSLVSGTLHDADGNDAILDHDALADDNHTRWTASGPPSPLSP
ncbi:MAG: hypothetical protein F4W95_00460 [Chloroflexi bacterium]|nr:hypothetical protein [Chloroflexota bacterium]MYD46939.1 hypothetical protein [Chloroflexota bacterium]